MAIDRIKWDMGSGQLAVSEIVELISRSIHAFHGYAFCCLLLSEDITCNGMTKRASEFH